MSVEACLAGALAVGATIATGAVGFAAVVAVGFAATATFFLVLESMGIRFEPIGEAGCSVLRLSACGNVSALRQKCCYTAKFSPMGKGRNLLLK